MKKMILTASVIFASMALAGCSKGIEKPAELQVKEIVQVRQSDGSTANAAHCKKKLSAFNYYIIVPVHELPADSAGANPKYDYSVLVATDGGNKEEFTLISDGSTVTDHGYKFSSWKEIKE